MSYETVRFIGGPDHNKVRAVPAGSTYWEVAQARRLPPLGEAVYHASSLSLKRYVYTRRTVLGITFFMLSTMNEIDYIAAIFGPKRSEKAQQRKKRKDRILMRKHAELLRSGHSLFTAPTAVNGTVQS